MLKAFIFDVDGTLVDSVDIHAKAWQDAFGAFGYSFPFDKIRGQIGKGGDQLLPVFLSQEQVEKDGDTLNERRAEILKERYLATIDGFPRVRALFERIKQQGFKIALASSAKGDELDAYKSKADIKGLVEEETSSDDAERSKPHGDIFQAALDRLSGVKPGEAVVIGDTPYDAEAAGKVGLRTIGVLCGGFPEAQLRDAGCTAIFRDPADMLDRFDELLEAAGG